MPTTTPSASTQTNSSKTMAGWIYGFIGMLGFNLTLPATRIAVAEMDPQLVAYGRALVAAVPAMLLLLIHHAPMPIGSQWRALAGVALGVVEGFPLACRQTTGRWSSPCCHLRRQRSPHGATVSASPTDSGDGAFWVRCW